MERSHRKLCTRLTDRLRSDNADSLTDLNCLACRHICTVTFCTDTNVRLTAENIADFHLFDRFTLLIDTLAHNSGCPARRNHMILLHQNIAIPVLDVLTGISACDSVLQSLDRLLAIHECSHFHTGYDILAFAAVHFTDNQLLTYIDHSACQISRVRCTKCCVGHSFSGAVRRHEVLQNVKSLSEIRLDRQLDGTPCRIRHQSTHTCQLLNLLVGTTRAGICHHKDVVILVKTADQLVCQRVIRLFPSLYDCLVALLVRHQSAPEIHGDTVNGLLRFLKHLRLLRRHCHIGDRHCHGSPCRIFVSHRFDTVEHLRGLCRTMNIDNLLQNLL